MKTNSSAGVSHFDLQKRLIHLLMYKSDFLKDNSLFYGKMGIALFFASYHRATAIPVYETIADELMEQIISNLPESSSVGLGKGLCGIGWGIEYLIQNGFLEGNSSDICEEINAKIMEKDPRRITDLSLENGLEGMLHYILAHISGAQRNGNPIAFDSTYLSDLLTSLSRHERQGNPTPAMATLIQSYKGFCTGHTKPDYHPDIAGFAEPIKIDGRNLTACPPGLKNGITGHLFHSLLHQPGSYEKCLPD